MARDTDLPDLGVCTVAGTLSPIPLRYLKAQDSIPMGLLLGRAPRYCLMRSLADIPLNGYRNISSSALFFPMQAGPFPSGSGVSSLPWKLGRTSGLTRERGMKVTLHGFQIQVIKETRLLPVSLLPLHLPWPQLP